MIKKFPISIRQLADQRAFTLIELLVAFSVFVVLALFTTQSFFSILQGRSKTEVSRIVRQEADYVVSVMERNLRAALAITSCSSTNISYMDFDGNSAAFSCQNVGGSDSYMASGSARLTTSSVAITSCSFTCSPPTNPSQVTLSFTVKQSQPAAGPRETAEISVSSQVQLRNQ